MRGVFLRWAGLACWAVRVQGAGCVGKRPNTAAAATREDCPGLFREPRVEIYNVFRRRWPLRRWICQPVARGLGAGSRRVGSRAIGRACTGRAGTCPVRACAGRDGRVRGASLLRRVGWLRAWHGLTPGGVDACLMQAFAGRGSCMLDAGPYWTGRSLVRCGLAMHGIATYLVQARISADETAESARVLLNSTDGGCLCLRF